jgi:cell filamentation protein
MDKYDVQSDCYCYQNSSVLINRLNISDEGDFENAEREITKISISNVHYSPPPYNLRYLQNIHIALFSELYDWVGEIRTVDISKSQTRFCNVNRIIPEVEKIFFNLDGENYLSGLPRNKLIERLAYFYGEFNMIHPFREGNGRVQRIFFEHLALYNEYNFLWSNIFSKDKWIEANIHSTFIGAEKLEEIFDSILVPAH